MDMSNKSLALLLVAAIIISMGGTLISLNKLGELESITGGATSGSGQVNLTITSNASCTVDSDVDFGSDAPSTTITVSSESSNSGNNFTDCTSGTACLGIYINNTGNTNLTINFTSSKNGSSFLGPPMINDSFNYLIDSAEPESGCDGTPGASSWTQAPINETNICDSLNFVNSGDTISLEFNVTLNESTTSGVKTTTINILCGQV